MPLLFSILRWLSLPFLAAAAYAGWKSFALALPGGFLTGHGPLFLSALGGAFLFRLLLALAARRIHFHNPFLFLDTLEHELTHALAGYLTFSPPLSLSATIREGGQVQLTRNNILVVLAPYGFPLATLLCLLASLAAAAAAQPWCQTAVYVLLGSFLFRLGGEFRWYQSDLQIYGRLFSSLLIALFLLLSVAAICRGTGMVSFDWVREAGGEFLDLGRLAQREIGNLFPGI